MSKKMKEVPQESLSRGLDYSVYVMNPLEKIMYFLLAGAVLFLLGFIFYKSIILSLLLSLLALKYPKIRTKQIIAARRRKLNLQFKDMLYSLSSAINAGNSVERALSITLGDMERQYSDPNAYIIKELELMVSKVSLNQNIEEVLMDFANRSGLEDIKTFASIFEISKRTGGNMITIIRQTTDVITEKIEVTTEMDTMLAGKKMEQKTLTAIPVAMLYLLDMTTDGFMDPIYTTPGGRIVATIALIMIGAGFLWSRKITNIEI